MELTSALTPVLEELERTATYRTLPLNPASADPSRQLCSNDYLGLASDRSLQTEFLRTLGPGTNWLAATGSRLLSGNHPGYLQLEDHLAQAYGREAALVFNSGYHANLGILPALLDDRDVIFSDRLNHASLLDGARLSGAKLIRYPHLDHVQLERLLTKHRSAFRHAVIVTESLFSMDGDRADLNHLAALKRAHDAWLLVDEAHALGVFGPRGLGLAEDQQALGSIDLLIGTFGKAFGSLGAFCVCDQIVREVLVNRMRPFIFTTALPPLIVAWSDFVLQRLGEWSERRTRLLTLAGKLRDGLQAAGLTTRGDSQIVPLVLGSNSAALAVAESLRGQGWQVLAVRPPAVPEGTARLRLAVTASLNAETLGSLPALAAAAWLRFSQAGSAIE